jgi:hypothetical protein
MDPTVNAGLRAGLPLEDVIVALVEDKDRLMQRILELASIAPRKITLPNGEVRVWRCPDEFVPETPH